MIPGFEVAVIYTEKATIFSPERPTSRSGMVAGLEIRFLIKTFLDL